MWLIIFFFEISAEGSFKTSVVVSDGSVMQFPRAHEVLRWFHFVSYLVTKPSILTVFSRTLCSWAF